MGASLVFTVCGQKATTKQHQVCSAQLGLAVDTCTHVSLRWILRLLESGSHLCPAGLACVYSYVDFSGRRLWDLFPYSALLGSTAATCSCQSTASLGISRSLCVKVDPDPEVGVWTYFTHLPREGVSEKEFRSFSQ